MKVLQKGELGMFLRALGDVRKVVAPLWEGVELAFGDLDVDRLATDCTGRTRFSAKEFLFPESEVLFSFDLSKQDQAAPIQEHLTEVPTVVWGIRPCDLAGLRVLDVVFLSDPTDVYYEARRKNTLLLALNCNEAAAPSCFCASFGTGPTAQEGFDLLFTDLGDRLLVEIGTEAGAALIQEQAAFFAEATEGDIETARAVAEEARGTFSTELDVARVKDELPALFDNPIWAEQAQKCTLCGTCCIVCPTCHCFNVEDLKETRKLAHRVRYWDCCQFTGFTRMAGENSRPTQPERWRQKIFDKFCYMPAAHEGLLGCTGCGRCLDLCQGGINIVQVLGRVTGGQE